MTSSRGLWVGSHQEILFVFGQQCIYLRAPPELEKMTIISSLDTNPEYVRLCGSSFFGVFNLRSDVMETLVYAVGTGWN